MIDKGKIAEVIEVICKHFNTDEVDGLCFSIGHNVEEIAGRGSNLRVYAQSLVPFISRRGEERQLLQAMVNQRPHLVDWARTIVSVEEPPEPVPPLPVHSTDKDRVMRDIAEKVEQISALAGEVNALLSLL